MERKIRVVAVSYLNTKPLIYGFANKEMEPQMELSFEYPAKVAASLLDGTADIGLLPVAVIPDLEQSYLVSDYCISTEGEVASVCLFSEVPLEEIKFVYLDYQSRTSVALLKILMKMHWKISPTLLDAVPGYEEMIKGDHAGLIIGDRALIKQGKCTYCYDLGTSWLEMTGLPFVFATWVANKKLPEKFIEQFNKATGLGLSHIDEIVQANEFPGYDLHTYYTKNIDYHFDDRKKAGLKRFLELL